MVLRHLRDHGVTTVEGLVNALPPLHRSHAALVFESQALGAEFVSDEFPRVVSWGADARFVLSWSTDPDSPFAESVEFLEPGRERWAAGVIDFSGDRPAIRYPAACATCHGDLRKPLWGFDIWFPGTEGDLGSTEPPRNGVGFQRLGLRLQADTAQALTAAAAAAHPRIEPLGIDYPGQNADGYPRGALDLEKGCHPDRKLSEHCVPLVTDASLSLSWRHAEILFRKIVSIGALAEARQQLCRPSSRFRFEPNHYLFRDLAFRVSRSPSLSVREDSGRDLKGTWGDGHVYRNGYNAMLDDFWFLALHDIAQRNAAVRQALKETAAPTLSEYAKEKQRWAGLTALDLLERVFDEAFGKRGQANIEARFNAVKLTSTANKTAGWTKDQLRKALPLACDVLVGDQPGELVGAPRVDPFEVAGLALVSATGKTAVQELAEDGRVDPGFDGARRFDLRAEPVAGAGSVRLALTGAGLASSVRTERIDDTAPYTLFDEGAGVALPPGDYLASAQAFAESGGGGASGPALTVGFTVDGALRDFRLFHPEGWGETEIRDGARIDVGGWRASTRSGTADQLDLSVAAADAAVVGSVRLSLAGPDGFRHARTANEAPYRLHGSGGFAALPSGSYTLTATPYSEAGRGGVAGGTQALAFTVERRSRIAIGNAQADEGEPLDFEVRISPPLDAEVTLRYETEDVCAAAGDDYEGHEGSTAGSLVVPAGASKAMLRVATLEDGAAENAETLRVRLSGLPRSAVAQRLAAVGTIVDDDG